jgi:hypothetical protein
LTRSGLRSVDHGGAPWLTVGQLDYGCPAWATAAQLDYGCRAWFAAARHQSRLPAH